MARTVARLTALKVARAKRPGMYPDGGGLYLQVTQGGASWVYRFMLNGRARQMGLGPVHTITLAEARERARQARKLQLDGIDPIERRRSERAAQRVAEATAMSFRQCGDAFIASHGAAWGAVHRRQWTNSLAKHVHLVIGDVRVHAIDTTLVMKVVEPLWRRIPETAYRIRGRIEAILDWAKVSGYRAGENPARWRGHLDKLLPPRGKVHKVEHHAALPYAEVPGFMAALREQEGIAAFLQGLQEAGWAVGRNVNIDVRWAAGEADRFRKYAMELVALAPDVILTSAPPSIRAMQEATRTVPIVFVLVPDAVGTGIVDSLSRPGGNTTGFTSTELGMPVKWLELLKEIAPKMTRAAVLRDVADATAIGQFGAVKGAAPSFGVEINAIGVRNAAEIERGVTAF